MRVVRSTANCSNNAPPCMGHHHLSQVENCGPALVPITSGLCARGTHVRVVVVGARPTLLEGAMVTPECAFCAGDAAYLCACTAAAAATSASISSRADVPDSGIPVGPGIWPCKACLAVLRAGWKGGRDGGAGAGVGFR